MILWLYTKRWQIVESSACKLAGMSDWLLMFQWGNNPEVTAESTHGASRSRWKRSLTSSSAAPISVRSQRVRAARGRERHRQASVLMKCQLSAAWVMTWGTVLPPTLPLALIGLSNLDLVSPIHEPRWGSGPFPQPADLNAGRNNGFVYNEINLSCSDVYVFYSNVFLIWTHRQLKNLTHLKSFNGARQDERSYPFIRHFNAW